ncbi:hypothetical protein Dsin_003961 [Dipteronia sinensis]|uniref:Uncharacterized protein n=1 Tax=Dipteronia sinensis TaxID=43782 RepID=A0AAE0B9W9_9ROSI|nr:hypothetical protein Dsin_003961 [Dipteronia sinensis]
MGAQSMPPAAGLRQTSPASTPNADGATMFNQQRSTASTLGDSFANQLDNGEQNSVKLQEATAAETKASSFFPNMLLLGRLFLLISLQYFIIIHIFVIFNLTNWSCLWKGSFRVLD